jgi:hypothetical protein
MKICKECGAEFRYNLVFDRRIGSKYLRSRCCDLAIRPCPNPSVLMRSANLSSDEGNYLARLNDLHCFSGQIVAVLLQIETKVQQAGEVRA